MIFRWRAIDLMVTMTMVMVRMENHLQDFVDLLLNDPVNERLSSSLIFYGILSQLLA
jgi:hypothetical protein